MFLSAFVFPGAGQLTQRRWISAFVFAITFLACFVVFMAIVFRIIFTYYAVGLDPDSVSPTEVPSVGPVLVLFATAVVVYIANIADAHRAYRRQCRNRALRKFRSKHEHVSI